MNDRISYTSHFENLDGSNLLNTEQKDRATVKIGSTEKCIIPFTTADDAFILTSLKFDECELEVAQDLDQGIIVIKVEITGRVAQLKINIKISGNLRFSRIV